MKIDIDYDYSRDDKLRLNGREVTSPIMSFLLQAVIVVVLGVFVPIAIWLGIVLAFCSWPLHLLLRAIGRKGFGSYDPIEGISLKIDRDSFQRVS